MTNYLECIRIARDTRTTMANCSCDHPAVITVGSLSVCDAPSNTTLYNLFMCYSFISYLVVGAWFLAVTIGVVGGSKLWGLGPSVVGSFSYSLIFYTYAVMISSGLVVHSLYLVECGVSPPTPVSNSLFYLYYTVITH